MKKNKIKIPVLFLLICASVFAQTGDAGREDLFYKGISAGIFGVGNAATAYAVEPSVFYWNPAGMVMVDEQSLGFSLTTLFEGTQYNGLSYIHPTLSTGYFGIGITRIGTDGIHVTDWDPAGNVIIEQSGTWSYWWGKLSLAYAIPVWKNISLGAAFHTNRQVLGTFSTNGFGFDGGIHYVSPIQRGLLSHLYLGASVSNLVKPTMKLGPTSETIPSISRLGIAKRFVLREKDHVLILFDMEKNTDKEMRSHFGLEYKYGGRAYLRIGMDGDRFGFGGGIRFSRFQLDYASGQIGDPLYFSRSHRVTIQAFLGKSLVDQRASIENEKMIEINRRTEESIQVENQRRIEESLAAGKAYFEAGDYFNARLEFSKILSENKDHPEAKSMLEQTTSKEQALQDEREQALLEEAITKEKQEQDNAFVHQKFTEGLTSLEKGEFQEAIEQWEEALRRDPDHPQIQQYIQSAQSALEEHVNRMIAQSNQFIRQDNIPQALQILERAKELTRGNEVLHNKVLNEIKNLDRILNYYTNYNAGIQRYSKGDYAGAAKFFKKALENAPTSERIRIQELYRKALVRSSGSKNETFSEQGRQLYIQGLLLFQDGKYAAALNTFQDAAKLDPQNVKIINAIETCKKYIKQTQDQN